MGNCFVIETGQAKYSLNRYNMYKLTMSSQSLNSSIPLIYGLKILNLQIKLLLLNLFAVETFEQRLSDVGNNILKGYLGCSGARFVNTVQILAGECKLVTDYQIAGFSLLSEHLCMFSQHTVGRNTESTEVIQNRLTSFCRAVKVDQFLSVDLSHHLYH